MVGGDGADAMADMDGMASVVGMDAMEGMRVRAWITLQGGTNSYL